LSKVEQSAVHHPPPSPPRNWKKLVGDPHPTPKDPACGPSKCFITTNKPIHPNLPAVTTHTP